MLVSMTHAEARKIIVAAFKAIFGRDPSRPEAQALQGIGWLETNYAQGWKGAGKGSWNWGAIQRGKPPCDPNTGFLYTDTHPNPDGSSTTYSICFRKYATAEDGAQDLARVVYKSRPRVLQAATRGDLWGVSAELYASRYYEGFGSTSQERIANHHKALLAAVGRQAKALTEPMPDGSLPPPPTLRRGSSGELVRDLQRLLNSALPVLDEGTHPDTLIADGRFGPATEARVRKYQEEHGLSADGIVGPKTWSKLGKSLWAAYR